MKEQVEYYICNIYMYLYYYYGMVYMDMFITVNPKFRSKQSGEQEKKC